MFTHTHSYDKKENTKTSNNIWWLGVIWVNQGQWTHNHSQLHT